MTKQFQPYFSRRAAGTITPGLTTRNTRGQAHLQRQPLSTRPRTTAQQRIAAFLHGVANAWSHWRAILEPGWKTTPDFQNQDAYHNYIAANMARRAIGLWPTLHYPPDPASTPKNVGSTLRVATSRALLVRIDDTDTVVPYLACFRLRIGSPATMTPKTTNLLKWTYLYDTRFHCIPCPAAGTYSLDIILINAYGVAGAQYTRDAIVIPD